WILNPSTLDNTILVELRFSMDHYHLMISQYTEPRKRWRSPCEWKITRDKQARS
ncbi:hypothetical protein GWI33_019356, partial [Rhynchophorus ferrugineus]